MKYNNIKCVIYFYKDLDSSLNLENIGNEVLKGIRIFFKIRGIEFF